ncbi:MAG TPA: hypothetical protein VNE17_08675, partial [Nitrolancea sp.]|nr:hypothetical protein [Nitrolancea sp.]
WSRTLVSEVIEAALNRLGIPAQRLPENVRVSRRGRYELWANFSEQIVAEIGDIRLDPVSYFIRER